jgi:Alpha-glutamyl/putrescinyl thymine pyrophosphorylase clade 3
VPRFCRHSRFIERCPICRESVPGLAPAKRSGRRTGTGKNSGDGAGAAKGKRGPTAARKGGAARGRRRGAGLHVVHERRAEDDGYRSPLVPGLRASLDAERFAQDIAFAAGRLNALSGEPPGLYGEMRAEADPERALWMCFLCAYLCPLEGEDPFAGIRAALGAGSGDAGLPGDAGGPSGRGGGLPDLEGIPLGPRTSHDPARGNATIEAYVQWAARAGSQAQSFTGDPDWTPTRRFERLFERLTLPGLARMGRYELLVTIGRVGLCEMRADALHFTNAPGAASGDLATLGAKRVFGIGETVHLEHRARELAEAAEIPVEALDHALADWEAGERACLGIPLEMLDRAALERARAALEL